MGFTGALGEVTVDTTKRALVVHDGATAGGWPAWSETMQQVKTGNMLWVDAVNGDDATGIRGRLQSPYRTLAAAKNAAMTNARTLTPTTSTPQACAPSSLPCSERIARPGLSETMLAESNRAMPATAHTSQ